MKYKLLPVGNLIFDKQLYLIQSLENFDDIKIGDFGGYIETEKNLSQEGKCWLYPNSIIVDDAKVTGNAKIFNLSTICVDAVVSGDAWISNSLIAGNSIISGFSLIENCYIVGNSYVTNQHHLKDDKLIKLFH